METFPPNSKKAAQQPRKVERVTSSAVRRRRPLGKQFSHTFFSGDARTALEYMIGNVVMPSIQDMIVEAFSSGIERLVKGETRRPRSPMMGGAAGAPRVDYRSMNPLVRQTTVPRTSRARHNFDDILLTSRSEAEEVLDRMFMLLGQDDRVSVSDLYELTGITPSHTDEKWGWTNLRGATVNRVRGGGYLLDLPEPEPLG